MTDEVVFWLLQEKQSSLTPMITKSYSFSSQSSEITFTIAVFIPDVSGENVISKVAEFPGRIGEEGVRLPIVK